MKVSKALISAVMMMPIVAHSQTWITYVVDKGTSVSSILYHLSIKPIYGRNGTLAQTIALNPELAHSKGNRVYPGQTIRLPRQVMTSQETSAPAAPAAPVMSENKIQEPKSQPSPEVEAVALDNDDNASALLTVGAGLDFFRIEGVDEVTGDDSVVLSAASPTLNLGYHLLWSPIYTFSVNAKIQKYKLDELNADQTFDEASGNKIDLSLKGMKKLSDRWAVGAGISFDQDLFFQANSPTELGVEKIMITKPGIHARYTALKKNNADAGVDGKLGINLGSKTSEYSIETGTHAGLGTFFRYYTQPQDKNYKSLEARMSYSVDNQDTSISTRKLTNLSFIILYDWRLPW